MTSVSLPDPVVRRAGPPRVDTRALERALRERAGGEVWGALVRGLAAGA